MKEPSPSRPVRIVGDEGGEVRLPFDVAAILGEHAELNVGPGQVVTLRSRKLRSAALIAEAGVKALEGPATLRHSTSPLTETERAALAEFLGA
jgi:hypothetical protein